MNPWGLVFIVIGAALVFIGYRGTQNSVYKTLTGHLPGVTTSAPPPPATTTPQNSPTSQGTVALA